VFIRVYLWLVLWAALVFRRFSIKVLAAAVFSGIPEDLSK